MRALGRRCGLLGAVVALAVIGAPPGGAAQREMDGRRLARELRSGRPVTLHDVVIASPLSLTGADSVRRVFECHRCRFLGPVSAHDVAFDRTVDLSGSVFERAVDFSGSTFQAPALFRAIDTGTSVQPDDCTLDAGGAGIPACFLRGVNFGLAVFEDFASFAGSKFVRGASFADVRFADATFHQAQIGTTVFDGAAFRGEALFNGTQFDHQASFGGTDFRGHTDFSGAAFGEGGDFSGAQFATGASFLAAEFSGTKDSDQAARFQSVTAGGDMNFTFALFDSGGGDVQANFAQFVSGASLVFRPARVPKKFALDMEKLQVRDLDMDVGYAANVENADDERAVLHTLENSAKARDDLRQANDAHYALEALKSRSYGPVTKALDYVFYRGVAGYFVRPLRPLIALLVLVSLVSLGRFVRTKTATQNPPAGARTRRAWRRTRTRCADYLTCMLDTFSLLGRGRLSADGEPTLALRLESLAYRILVVCAVLALANSNPTLRQMVDSLI